MSNLLDLASPHEALGPRLTCLADLLAEADADARELYKAKQEGRARGPVTNLDHLDREIGGALFPGVHIVLGVPGAGKSALVLQVASNCACPALFVTCEMRPIALLKRLSARVTETYLGRFSTGELRPEHAANLYRRAAAESPNLALLDATTSPADARTIWLAAETTRKLEPSTRHMLIILDSLHTFADALPGEAMEYDRLNEALACLRNLSARLSCPILAVAERNRSGMAKGGLNAGAGTRKIEYGAETVLDLDIGVGTQDDPTGEKSITLKLAKNRSGSAGKEIHLLFHGGFQRFREDPH